MPTMPSGLKPVVAGYSMDDPGGVMRTDVAGGMPRYALDWDRGSQRFQITLILDAPQFSTWEAFYHWQTRKGSIAFSMQMDSGFGMAPHTVNIMPGTYSAARTNGIMMVVSFVAETENQVYQMSAADADNIVALFNVYGPYSTALLNQLAQFANFDSNVLNF